MLRITILSLLLLAVPTRAANAPDETLTLLIDVIKSTEDPGAQADMLKGLNAAMEGKRNIKMPAAWPDLYAKLKDSPNETVRKEAQKLAASFGDVGTLLQIKKIAADASQKPEDRLKALDTLVQKNDPELAPLLQTFLTDKILREPAIKGLANSDDPNTPAALIKAYPEFDTASRNAALNTLSFRKAWARELMKAVQGGTIPSKDLTAYTVRQLRTLNDKEIDAWITRTWGVARSTPDDKLKQVEALKKELTPEVFARADLSAGRALFAKTCQQCHTLYGEGGKVGPDITGANRADLDYLLVNIIDPSAVIPKDYQVTNVWTKDDQILSGILTRDEPQAITITTETGNNTVERSNIDTLKMSELSMMPEGLLLPLSKQDVTNLLAYLKHTSQVPLPPEPKK